MMMFFSIGLVVLSCVSIEASQKALSRDDKKNVQEVCLCAPCNPWWRTSWLFSARPHPLSKEEESVVQALYALPFMHASSGSGTRPFCDLIFKYIDGDIGTPDQNTQWVTQSTNRHVFSLNLHSCERSDWLSHGNTLNVNEWEMDNRSIVPQHVVFDDGDCQKYYATGMGECVQFGNLHSGRPIERRGQDPEKGKYAKCFEKKSTCGKYKLIIRNDGNYCGGSERAMTVIVQYNIGPLQQRIINRLKSLEFERQEKRKK